MKKFFIYNILYRIYSTEIEDHINDTYGNILLKEFINNEKIIFICERNNKINILYYNPKNNNLVLSNKEFSPILTKKKIYHSNEIRSFSSEYLNQKFKNKLYLTSIYNLLISWNEEYFLTFIKICNKHINDCF